MTRQEEIHVINTFREMYKNFPIGNLEHPDKPDFIVIDGSKRIGIETTQVVHSKKAKQISSEQVNFTDLVISKLIHLLPFHFSLSIDLLTDIGVSKSKKEQIATDVANFCVGEFSTLEDTKHADAEHVDFDFATGDLWIRNHLFEMGFRNLPKGVKSISIFRCDAHGSSFNSKSEASFIPRFSKEKLAEVLKEKEIKLQSYKPCDECWLIIWQGWGITGYFKDIQFETPISSTFDKVFILRNAQNDIIPLKP